MFYAAGLILEDAIENKKDIKVEDVFTAMFAIMFGASHAGSAAAMGPDIGKATSAANSIFKIIDEPSPINAIEMDKLKNKKIVSKEDFKGKIEFKNVWFRYPTRKEDFVLRGLNITINP